MSAIRTRAPSGRILAENPYTFTEAGKIDGLAAEYKWKSSSSSRPQDVVDLTSCTMWEFLDYPAAFTTNGVFHAPPPFDGRYEFSFNPDFHKMSDNASRDDEGLGYGGSFKDGHHYWSTLAPYYYRTISVSQTYKFNCAICMDPAAYVTLMGPLIITRTLACTEQCEARQTVTKHTYTCTPRIEGTCEPQNCP